MLKMNRFFNIQKFLFIRYVILALLLGIASDALSNPWPPESMVPTVAELDTWGFTATEYNVLVNQRFEILKLSRELAGMKPQVDAITRNPYPPAGVLEFRGDIDIASSGASDSALMQRAKMEVDTLLWERGALRRGQPASSFRANGAHQKVIQPLQAQYLERKIALNRTISRFKKIHAQLTAETKKVKPVGPGGAKTKPSSAGSAQRTSPDHSRDTSSVSGIGKVVVITTISELANCIENQIDATDCLSSIIKKNGLAASFGALMAKLPPGAQGFLLKIGQTGSSIFVHYEAARLAGKLVYELNLWAAAEMDRYWREKERREWVANNLSGRDLGADVDALIRSAQEQFEEAGRSSILENCERLRDLAYEADRLGTKAKGVASKIPNESVVKEINALEEKEFYVGLTAYDALLTRYREQYSSINVALEREIWNATRCGNENTLNQIADFALRYQQQIAELESNCNQEALYYGDPTTSDLLEKSRQSLSAFFAARNELHVIESDMPSGYEFDRIREKIRVSESAFEQTRDRFNARAEALRHAYFESTNLADPALARDIENQLQRLDEALIGLGNIAVCDVDMLSRQYYEGWDKLTRAQYLLREINVDHEEILGDIQAVRKKGPSSIQGEFFALGKKTGSLKDKIEAIRDKLQKCRADLAMGKNAQSASYGTGYSFGSTDGSSGVDQSQATHEISGGFKIVGLSELVARLSPDDKQTTYSAADYGGKPHTSGVFWATSDETVLRIDSRTGEAVAQRAGYATVFARKDDLSDFLTVKVAVEAPVLTGMSLRDAESLARSLNFKLKVSLDDEPAGDAQTRDRVVGDQIPVAGTHLEEGDVVTIVLTEGAMVTVPNVAGKLFEDARSALLSAGLEPGGFPSLGPAADSEQSVGKVFATNPETGARVAPGTPVNLIVYGNLPTLEVPDLYGLSVEQARRKLASAGLLLGDVLQGSLAPEGAQSATVQLTQPAKDTRVAPNTKVHLTVYGRQSPNLSSVSCAAYPGAESTYDPVTRSTVCRCADGSDPSRSPEGCGSALSATGKDTFHSMDCSRYPGSSPVYLHHQGLTVCLCPDGTRADHKPGGCVIERVIAKPPKPTTAPAISGGQRAPVPADSRIDEQRRALAAERARLQAEQLAAERRRRAAEAQRRKQEALIGLSRQVGDMAQKYIESQANRTTTRTPIPSPPRAPTNWPPRTGPARSLPPMTTMQQSPQGPTRPLPAVTPPPSAPPRPPVVNQPPPQPPAADPVLPGLGPIMGIDAPPDTR